MFLFLNGIKSHVHAAKGKKDLFLEGTFDHSVYRILASVILSNQIDESTRLQEELFSIVSIVIETMTFPDVLQETS